MTSSGVTDGPPVGGDPIGPGFFRSVLQGLPGKRRRQVVTIAIVSLVLIIVLGVSVVVFSSLSRESQSYKDGFTEGGVVYSADSTAQRAPREACLLMERVGPSYGGLPKHDNAAQWLKGCTTAFESAQAGN